LKFWTVPAGVVQLGVSEELFGQAPGTAALKAMVAVAVCVPDGSGGLK
jgi:hypothetical protein